MKRILIICAALACAATALAATTVNIPVQVSVTNPTLTGAGMVTVSVGAITTVIAIPAVPPPVVVTPPPVTPPPVTPPPVVIPPPAPAGVSWVYHNGAKQGVFDLDVSFAGSANYSDTAGLPVSGVADIAFSGSAYNGGWQLMSSKCQSNVSACLDTTAYKFLIFQIKPTVNGQQWQVGFMSAGDTPDGKVIDISPYCPKSVAGVWGACKAPLSAFGLTNPKVLKFWLQGNTNGVTKFYVDDAGYSPN